MSTAFTAVTKGIAALAVVTMLLLPAPAVAQSPERKPMTIEDVLRMVEQGVRPQTILAALRQNCLAVYGLNQEMQQRLATAGAEAELVDGLRQVCWGAPGGPVMDPTQPFVMILEPGAWVADTPQPLSMQPGGSIRVQGLAHAPSGVERLEVNGTPITLSSDPAGGARFSTVVTVRPGMEAIEVVLYPESGDAYRKTLPLNVAAASPAASGRVTRAAYNPGSVAMSGIIPGMAQFRTGNPVLGTVVLGGAGAALAAGLLSTRTVVRCGADADPCPSGSILSEETERPLLVPGMAAAVGITALGAFLGYRSAQVANERGTRVSGSIESSASHTLGQAILQRLPSPTSSGGWAVELGRFHF